MSGARTDAENNAQTEAQTEETNLEAEYIRENLWIFRLKRGLWPALFVHPLLTEDEYLDIESGKKPICEREMRALAEQYKIAPHSLAEPPDYRLLLDAPTRRLIDYSYTALTRRRRMQFASFLNSFMVKRR
jgi:hypothetical protein